MLPCAFKKLLVSKVLTNKCVLCQSCNCVGVVFGLSGMVFLPMPCQGWRRSDLGMDSGKGIAVVVWALPEEPGLEILSTEKRQNKAGAGLTEKCRQMCQMKGAEGRKRKQAGEGPRWK